MAVTLLTHKITKFKYNAENVSHNETEIPVLTSGTIGVSNNGLPGSINVDLEFVLGEKDKPLFMISTRTSFSYDEKDDSKEENVRKECVPVSLERMNSDVNKMIDSLDIHNIVLPDLTDDSKKTTAAEV